jgi:hypothetical protein
MENLSIRDVDVFCRDTRGLPRSDKRDKGETSLFSPQHLRVLGSIG